MNRVETYRVCNPDNGITLTLIQASSYEKAVQLLLEQTPYDPDKVVITRN